jgi:hypothetical protein
MVAERPEPVSAPEPLSVSEPALQSSFAVAPEPAAAVSIAPELAPEPSLELSLGSSLLASGIVRGHTPSRPDPLAAIRRMSQAEKIAFFS